MQTTVKNLSETKVQLTIKVGASELAAAEQVALTKLGKKLKVAGFREGKVPASVVAKNVDPGALQEQTLDDALSRAVAEAFLNEKLQALDRPSVEVKAYVPRESLEFTAEVEVMPAVELGDYKKLKVSVEKVVVSDDEIDEIIERMRQGFASKESAKRAAKDGDEVVIDFVGKKDDVAFDGGTATDYSLTLGSHQFIPGFEEGIVGHKVGDKFDLDLEFPKDYHAKELAGAKVVFSVTLKEVKEVKLPEVNDEFAAKAGPFTSVDELKADIQREIASQKEREAGEKLKDQLVEQLVSVSKVPAPEILVNDQMQSIERDFSQNLLYQGLTLDSYITSKDFKDEADWREKEVKPAAVRRVEAALVLGELSKVEKITATNEELEAHIDLYKQQYANNKEVLKQFEQPEVRRDIANRLLTEKTVDRLVELNSVSK